MTQPTTTADQAASYAQLETIHKIVCHIGAYKQHWRTPWSETAQYLNSRFNLNLDAELEPLSRTEASRIIQELKH